jgi:photoactive yellow protein
MTGNPALLALSEISYDEFEAAPFGGIIVDHNGEIERYNHWESELSHLPPERVTGKNFFTHVAPCTAVRAFEGRFQDFIASNDIASEGFTYFFPFSHGDCDVYVSFVKLAKVDLTLIVVERVDNARVASIKDFYSPISPR